MSFIDDRIEAEAQKLLDEYGFDQLPIQVDGVAKRRGLEVIPFDLGTDVSGVLYIKNNSATIGYNPNESKVRQRFTIAHELGHYMLHDDKIYVDNENYFQLKLRSPNSGNYVQEKEANAFAAALLMPKALVQKEVKNLPVFDLSDNTHITELAKKFDVSIPAMSFRIMNLMQNGDL